MMDVEYWKSLPKFAKLPTTYAGLVKIYQPRPIHGFVELEAATKMIDAMAGHELSADQDDYLDLLSTLVAAYEDAHFSAEAGKMSPQEVVGVLLEESGMSASELGRLLGSRDLGSKILRGERGLSLNHVAILAERFAVGAELFISRAKGRKKTVTKSKGAAAWRGGHGVRVR